MSFLDRFRRGANLRPEPPARNSVLDIVSVFAPTPQPALRQEQFADNHQQVAQQEIRMHTVILRTIAVNNSAVERDYGRGVTIDESRPMREELYIAMREIPATPEELKTAGIEVIEGPATRAQLKAFGFPVP